MEDGFIFGGKSTREFAVHVEKYPPLGGSKRKRTTVSVAGRNGDLHFTENAFTNYPQRYECYFHGERSTPEMAHAVQAWLMNGGEYRRLEDDYDPRHFRMATFAGPLDIENQFNQYGRCVVEFDCAPQSFLKSGEHPVEFTTGGVLWNPTDFVAQPIIKVYGSGAGVVTIGATVVTIHEITDSLVLDCEMQNAYRQGADGSVENKNRSIKAHVFPNLAPGDNLIAWLGDITKIEIIPRWWEL